MAAAQPGATGGKGTEGGKGAGSPGVVTSFTAWQEQQRQPKHPGGTTAASPKFDGSGAEQTVAPGQKLLELKTKALEGRVQKLMQNEADLKKHITGLEEQVLTAQGEAEKCREQLHQAQKKLESSEMRSAQTASAVAALEQRVTALLAEHKAAQAAALKWNNAVRAVAGSSAERWAAEAAARNELRREVLERDGDHLREQAAAMLMRDMLKDPATRARAEQKAIQELRDDPHIYDRALEEHEMDARIAQLRDTIRLTEHATEAELRAQRLAEKVWLLQAELEAAREPQGQDMHGTHRGQVLAEQDQERRRVIEGRFGSGSVPPDPSERTVSQEVKVAEVREVAAALPELSAATGTPALLGDLQLLLVDSGAVMQLSESVHEVTDFAVATPATVSRCGLMFVDSSELGWTAALSQWIHTMVDFLGLRDRQYTAAFIETMLKKGMNWLCKESRQTFMQSEVQVCRTLRNLFRSLCRTLKVEYIEQNPAAETDADGPATPQELFDVAARYMLEDGAEPSGPRSVYDLQIDFHSRLLVPWAQHQDAPRYGPSTPYVDIIVPSVYNLRYSFPVCTLRDRLHSVLGLMVGMGGSHGIAGILKNALSGCGPAESGCPNRFLTQGIMQMKPRIRLSPNPAYRLWAHDNMRLFNDRPIREDHHGCEGVADTAQPPALFEMFFAEYKNIGTNRNLAMVPFTEHCYKYSRVARIVCQPRGDVGQDCSVKQAMHAGSGPRRSCGTQTDAPPPKVDQSVGTEDGPNAAVAMRLRGAVELHPTPRRRRRGRRGDPAYLSKSAEAAPGGGAPDSCEKRAEAMPRERKAVMHLQPERPPPRSLPRGARAR
eukprot:TRINITY_DN21922_c0_g3_i1.p1 TRINITY_DN21922_c0_g3~~TRINITY_DN21922_c0_g3_i1.p1  ORF type:complete len:854 (+),score=284.21 TRINITY_DN21922_c0_g3_i1:61-2562(+)